MCWATWPGETRRLSTSPIPVRARCWFLHFLLSVVAVRSVVRLRSFRPQRDRGCDRHYTMGGLRFSGPRRGGSTAAQAQLSILVGLTVLVKGVSYWFDQYELAIERSNRLFTGISYTADNATVTAR